MLYTTRITLHPAEGAYCKQRSSGLPTRCWQTLSVHAATPMKPHERVDELLCAFGGLLQQQMRRVPQLLERRRGELPVTLDASTARKCVADIGSYFQVQGLTRTALELLRTLTHMDEDFQNPSSLPKWTDSVQLLRVVAAPGMGKVRMDGPRWADHTGAEGCRAGAEGCGAGAEGCGAGAEGCRAGVRGAGQVHLLRGAGQGLRGVGCVGKPALRAGIRG